MNIRYLKIFIEVANCGSMSGAAKRLFISQPSVSQAIKEIEEYYGVILFERLAKKLYITTQGKVLLSYARHIVSTFEEMEITLKNTGEKATLKIGASVTVGSCILNQITKEFELTMSNTSTEITVNNTNIIENLILQSELDVAIVEGEITNIDLIKIPIYKDELVIVVGKNHHLYKKEIIDIEDLKNEYLISREQGSAARVLFDDFLSKNNIKMKIKWCCTTTEAIKSAAIQGEGLAVLSRLIIDNEVNNKELHILPIKNTNFFRDICVVYHKDKFLSDKLKLFIELAKAYKL